MWSFTLSIIRCQHETWHFENEFSNNRERLTLFYILCCSPFINSNIHSIMYGCLTHIIINITLTRKPSFQQYLHATLCFTLCNLHGYSMFYFVQSTWMPLFTWCNLHGYCVFYLMQSTWLLCILLDAIYMDALCFTWCNLHGCPVFYLMQSTWLLYVLLCEIYMAVLCFTWCNNSINGNS